jgi:hypothetical protein
MIALVQPFFGKGADPTSIVHAGIVSGMYLLITRPTVMHKRHYFSLTLFFRDIAIIIQSAWYTYILPLFQNVQSSHANRLFAGFLCVDILLVALVTWLFKISLFAPHVMQYIALMSGPLFPGYHAMHTSPLFVFVCMSVLDAGYHIRDIMFAPLRAFMMIVYNYPLCSILFWICNGIQMGLHYITSRYYVVYYAELFFVIPCFICLWVNLYIMFVHKQFKVYYDVPD